MPSPRLATLAAVTIASTSAILVKLSQASPVTAAFYRTAYAIPVLVLLRLVLPAPGRTGRDRAGSLAAGALLTLDLLLFHAAIDDIGAGLAVVMLQTQVLFVTVVAWLWHRERPRRSAVFALGVAAAGVALVSGMGGEVEGNVVRGVILGLGAGASFGLFLVVFRWSNRSLSPSAGPLLDVCIGAAFLSLAAAPLLGGVAAPGMGDLHHFWLVVLALGVQVGAWLLFTYALPRLGALDTSATILLQPVLAMGWAQVVFGEPVGAAQWLGAGLVTVAVVLIGTGDATARGMGGGPHSL